MEVKRVLTKVIAYITRQQDCKLQLLVFSHRDYPDAGIQVPAGTVEDGESIESALAREISEETGLERLQVVSKLGVFNYTHPETGNLHVRHVFHLSAPSGTPNSWDWIETSGGEVTEDEGYVFQFHWADLKDKIYLAGGQGDYLHLMVLDSET